MYPRFISYLALVLVLGWGLPALAGSRDALVLPAQIDAPAPAAPVDLEPLARRLDAVMREAVQDFGFTPLTPGAELLDPDEQTLIELARDAWVVLPRLGLRGGALSLRLVVVRQASNVVLVRAQHVDAEEVEVRSLGMLRELLEPSLLSLREPCVAPQAAGPLPPHAELASHSEGRAVLALHAAALGGYLGFALQRASGSDDARLTYPLAALGAGVGVGSAVIVSEEWDINVARAWFLGASMVWPGVATLLIVDGDEEQESPGRRHLLGIVSAVGGLTLATAGLALGEVDEGGAALTHSGAALGLLLGGLGEMTLQGDADVTPTLGMGWGALAGVVLSGAAATQFEVPSATDMLFVDLSALLGGLAGAALGTPVLVSQDPSPTRDRIWLSGVMAGTVAGAGIGYWVTQAGGSERPNTGAEPASGSGGGLSVRPQLGWMGMPLGLGLSGHW
jgi:hypothetical protein